MQKKGLKKSYRNTCNLKNPLVINFACDEKKTKKKKKTKTKKSNKQ